MKDIQYKSKTIGIQFDGFYIGYIYNNGKLITL